jgi:hypothetical protein
MHPASEDDNDQIPHLMPLKKKRFEHQISTPSEKNSAMNDSNNVFRDFQKATPKTQNDK